MSQHAIFEEKKVQEALEFHRSNPGISLMEASRIKHALYSRVWRRANGTPASNSRGGTNKKLQEPQNEALKDYLLMYFMLGRSASI